MHIVKKFEYSLYWYITRKKLDSIWLRYDLKATKIKSTFWVTKNSDGTTNAHVPTSWIMTKYEVNILHNLIRAIKIPMIYASSLRKAFIIYGKMIGLKSLLLSQLIEGILILYAYQKLYIHLYSYIFWLI